MEQPLDNMSEFGKQKGLVLMLDAHSDVLSPGSVDNDFEGFTGLISPQNTFPMMGYNGFRIKPGHISPNFNFDSTKLYLPSNLNISSQSIPSSIFLSV
jgi:hypothetical protein